MFASLLVGIVGYSIFTTNLTETNILNNFSNTNKLINFARALFAIDMFLTYPLELFIAREVIVNMAELVNPEIFPANKRTSNLMHYGVTLGLITITTVIGTLTCNLGVVLELTGGVAASSIAFIFPSACTMYINKAPYMRYSNINHILCISFGILMVFLTTCSVIAEQIYSHSSKTCHYMNY
jgi:sodium-coupled neutral amino acid transporter 11